jgi:putative AdoMet-dependent methyltransferase
MKSDFGCHDNQANRYDNCVRTNLGDYIRENYFDILDRIIRLSDLQTGVRILDIGVGTGLLTERLPSGVAVCGIDISEKMMLKIQKKRLDVELKYGSFLKIPYDSSSFDRVISSFAFHHVSDNKKEQAFCEMNRVLHKNGKIIIGDFMFENDLQKEALIRKFEKEKRSDMLDEMKEEHFTNIEIASKWLTRLGYDISCERASTLSWILIAKR